MQENDKFRELLGKTLRNFEVTPPADMWDRIESGLKQRRKRRLMIFRYTSIAATILLLLGFGINQLFTPVTDTTISKSDPAKKSQVSQGEPDNKNNLPNTATVKDEKTSTGVNNKDSKQSKSKNLKKTKSVKTQRTSPGVINNTINGIVADAEKMLNPVNTVDIEITEDIISFDRPDILILPHLPDYAYDLALLSNEKSDEENLINNWGVGLAYAVSSGADFSKESAALDEGGRGYSYDEFSASIANGTSYFEEVENAIHDAPLSIGFTVDKQIGKRLSFETGLIYTRLKFKVKTNDLDPFYREYRNELYYLGVPAGIRYSFVNGKRFNLYALQWAVLEKGISGTWITDTYNNQLMVSSESARSKIRGLQLSSVTGIGGQMKIAGKIYLFGQGGAQIFYLNKTQPYNLRSTKKVWPSLQAGLRLNLGK